jgi:hypothetical protein
MKHGKPISGCPTRTTKAVKAVLQITSYVTEHCFIMISNAANGTV